MKDLNVESKYLTVSDGIRLRYLEAGEGKPLVLIHGWAQCAEQYKYQIEGLSKHYHVIALDSRGHGDSDKPGFGYKVQRLSKDVHDLLEALNLRDVNLLGHSTGCAVLWGYWDLFGANRLAKLILVDEPPMPTGNPTWTSAETDAAGCVFPSAEGAIDMCNGLAGPEGDTIATNFVTNIFTKDCPEDIKQWAAECTLRMPRKASADLMLNVAFQDWRDVIPRITLPTLVIGGRVSFVPYKAMEWVAQQIKGSKLVIFEEDEGGQHFTFIENPDKFNRIVADFIG